MQWCKSKATDSCRVSYKSVTTGFGKRVEIQKLLLLILASVSGLAAVLHAGSIPAVTPSALQLYPTTDRSQFKVSVMSGNIVINKYLAE
jgi:hypothetical protein